MIQPRVPQIDWSRGFARHWNGGNPAATHFFNALSFLFPQGERFFIDQAREVAAGVDLSGDPSLAAAVKAFIAQEAIHGHQHSQYNDVLSGQGYDNVSAELALRLEAHSYRVFSPLTRLAIVCAYEHYTAALGDYVLTHPTVLEQAPAEMQLVWGWHAVEETEHKSVCFDLYRYAGGGWLRRVLIFVKVSANFSRLFWRLYLDLLRRDGCFARERRWQTLRDTARFLAGRRGIAWTVLAAGMRYLAPGFHPWNQDNRDRMQHWLAAHQSSLRPVKR